MKHHSKFLTALICLMLLITVTAGSTLAFLLDSSTPITNVFNPILVSTAVVETVTNRGVKKNVMIRNTGTTDAYIRVAVVVTWQDENGNVYGQRPVAGRDYTILYNSKDWVQQDNFWYWTEPVAPMATTSTLISSCQPENTAPEGYSLTVEILASGIQSQPKSVAATNWGITINEKGEVVMP